MDTATKTGTDTAKTVSKRLTQKTAEAKGDLSGNRIADKSLQLVNQKKKQESRSLHSIRKKTTNC